MKNHYCIYIFLFFLLLTFSTSWAQKTYYLAASGNDGNDGLSTSSPIKTIDKLNTISLSAGDQVLFKKGDTFSGQIAVNHSGGSSNPITYGSYGSGNKPVISGAITVNFTSSGASTYQATVTDKVTDLHIGQNKARLAREPNTGFFTIESVSATTITDNSNLSKGANYFQNANVRIRTSNYTFEARKITGSGSGVINWSDNLHYTPTAGYGYYLDNHLDFLDNNNEWYYDESAQKIFYYGNSNPGNGLATIYDYGAKFGTNVSNITFDGLTFKYQYYDAINLYGTISNVNITNCEFRDIARHAITFTGAFTKINISNNLFQDIYGSGIMSSSLSDTEISFNTFKDIGLWQGYGAVFGFPINNNSGIGISGKNIHVHHNTTENTGYSGIRVDGQDNIIEKNIVKNAVLTLNDGGGIYTWGEVSFNSTFRFNLVDNVVGNTDGTPGKGLIIAALYLDNGSHENTIEGNILLNSSHMGLLSNRGTSGHIIKDNMFFNYDLNGIVFANDTDDRINVNNLFTGNTLVSLKPNNYFISKSTTNTTDNYDPGTLNSNTYFNPFNEIGFKSSKTGGNTIHREFSLPAWQDETGNEGTSKNFFLGWNQYETTDTTGNNLINNGTFDSDVNGWSKWTNGTATINHVPGELNAGALNLSLTSSGANDIAFAINVLKEPLKANQWYQMAFTAKGNKNANLEVVPKQHFGTYSPLGVTRKVPLFTNAEDYRYTFKITEDTDPARVDFQINPNAQTYWLDNVSLYPVSVAKRDPHQKIKVFYNASDDEKTINLPGGVYTKLDNTTVTGSITLDAWSAIVLIADGNFDSDHDATLKGLTVAQGTLSPTFTNANTTYSVQLPSGTTNVPEVTAIANHVDASLQIEPAINLKGSQRERTTTITVTANDGVTTMTYHVVFHLQPEAGKDATLKNLTASEGTLVPVFSPGIMNYEVKLAPGETFIPDITATPNDASATMEINQAIDLNTSLIERTATVKVTAIDGVTTQTYSVVFNNGSELQDFILYAPNQFSPNGDGIDDFWIIPDIERVANNLISIFNRSGQLVYKTTNYQNTWDGINLNGSPLITGPYFYIVKDAAGKAVASGTVNLLR
jgi:gliding motility-associated-like protein